MACVLSAGVTIDCKDSHGGVKVLGLANFAVGAFTPTIVAGVITVWAGAAAKFFKYQVQSETAENTENGNSNPANGTTEYEQAGTFEIRKLSATQSQELIKVLQSRLFVIFTDVNGKTFLHGYNNGVDAKYTSTTGKAMLDLNGYKISYIGKEETPMLEITASAVAALFA